MTRKSGPLAFVAWMCLLAAARAGAQPAAEWHYSVKPGDNPWSITERLLGGMKYWPMVQKHNGIIDPLTIAPGTTLRIPIDWLRAEPGHAVILTTSPEGCQVPGGGDADTPVHKGDKLPAGTVVRSTPGGSCTLQFPDRSKVLLLENSELSLERMISYAMTGMHDIVTRLLRGRVETTVTPASGPASRFEIHSPQGVTSVRGTIYRVASLGADARAEVIDGSVEVRNGLGRVALEAGTGTVFSTGSAPTAPTPLLAPPVLAELPSSLRLAQKPPSFPAVPGAAAYRQQYAGDANFDLPLSDLRTEDTLLHIPALTAGDYFLRVRAIDSLGLEGRDTVRALRLQQLLPAPDACAPADGGRVLGNRVTATCQAVPTAQWYRVQLARDRAFTAPQIDWLRSEPSSDLPLDQPGQFFWRIAAIDKSGQEGEFTPPMALLRALEAPALELAALGRESLTFSWQPHHPALQYRLQLASDESFRTLLEDHTTAGSRLVVPRPRLGAYFVRIGVIEDPAGEPVFGAVHGVNIPPLGTLDWLPPLGLVFLFLL